MKLYANREIQALGQRYCDHVMQMTAEGLHAKSDIAAELAWRDWQIECERDGRLRALRQRDAIRSALERIVDAMDRFLRGAPVRDADEIIEECKSLGELHGR